MELVRGEDGKCHGGGVRKSAMEAELSLDQSSAARETRSQCSDTHRGISASIELLVRNSYVHDFSLKSAGVRYLSGKELGIVRKNVTVV